MLCLIELCWRIPPYGHPCGLHEYSR